MGKRILIAVLLCALMLTVCTPAMAAESGEGAAFTVVSVPYTDETVNYNRLYARYADDKTPIPLSTYYDGKVFATVPVENIGRAIEAFLPEDIEFTDYDVRHYEFYIMKQLACSGVIRGNEKGEALPFDNITRAEAAAIVMRFMGLEASAGVSSGFTDVPEGEWYAAAVTAAKKYGIVNGDSETTFNPDRSVSREEFTVMAARTLWYAGMRHENTDATVEDLNAVRKYEDAEAISTWALSAYEALGNCPPEDAEDLRPENIGDPDLLVFARPQNTIMRFEAAELLSIAQRVFQVYPSQAALMYGFDKAMPTIDGSTSTYPFTQAVYSNLFKNGHAGMPKSHSKSHVSYERLINGEVDMLFASVYPASDILALAKEKGVELELIPIAYDAMVFFTNAENPAMGLTKAQISDIYVNNAYENWRDLGGTDALLYPYCRNYDSGSQAQMERHFLNGGEIHEKIRSETTSVSMSNVLTDVLRAQTDDPVGYGLGYSIFYYYNNMDMIYGTKTTLKLLAIDGVDPTDETIADGSYPLSNNSYVVLRADTPAGAPARRMAEFMLTPSGQKCVTQAGYGPLTAGE